MLNRKETKILFLGLDGSGKSVIVTKLKDLRNDDITEIYPTPFMKVDKMTFENKPVTIIEISGQQRFRRYWQMFYADTQGIVFVIDGTDVKRLSIIKELTDEMDIHLEKRKPIVFLINKQDVEGCLTKTEVKEFLNLDRLDSNFIWTIKNCIGFTGLGTKDALHFIFENTLA